MNLALADLRAFEETLQTKVPGFKVKFKDESTFMKVLGFLSFPFNPKFMGSYTTTIGKTVYFPSRAGYEASPGKSFRTLAHEFVHMWDGGLWFSLSYLFPQVLAVIPLLVFAVLAWPHTWLLSMLLGGYILAAGVAQKSLVGFAVVLGTVGLVMVGLTIFLTGWSVLALVSALVCLAPWPAPWRAHWELRGYRMSLAVDQWLSGRTSLEVRDRIVEHFVGPDYYFMSWGRYAITVDLDRTAREAYSGVLQEQAPYQVVWQFLASRNLLS